MTSKPQVILIHGVFMRSWIMYPLARRLRLRGFECEAFNYPFKCPPIDQVAEALATFAKRNTEGNNFLFVGHSLGGIIALKAAALLPNSTGKIVALGSPFLGSAVGRRVASCKLGRWAFAGALPMWELGVNLSIPDGWQCGIVAGTSPIGVGRLLGVELGSLNDGTVSASETRLPGACAWVEVKSSHTTLPFSKEVAEWTATFLTY